MAGVRWNWVCVGARLSLIVGLAVAGGCAQEASQSPVTKDPHAYKLIGIIQGDSKQAGAVFEDPQTRKQRFVQIGERLGGATLTDVRRDAVQLERDGEMITLRLTSGTQEEHRDLDPIPIPVGLNDPLRARQAIISKVIPPYDARVEKARMAISRDDVKSFVSYFQDQLNAGSPVLTSTSVGEAVELSHVTGNLLRSLGLESTDLIVGINGMGVDSTDRFRQILELLGKGQGNRGVVLNIVVLRGEAVQPLYYGINSKS